MRKLAISIIAGALLTLGAAAPAFAHDAGPCNDSGGPGNSDYAQHHIVAAAHEQELGAGGHIPGSHQGFSLCLGVHD